MNAFEFGKLIGEKTAAGPVTQPTAQPNSMLNQAKSFAGNVANRAIQSPVGQTALRGVSAGYNNLMPQAGRSFIGKNMPTYAEPGEMASMRGARNVAPTPYTPLSEQYGAQVNSNTVTQNDQLVKDQIDTHTPARVTGSPLQQIGFGLSHGQMPQQTFPQGSAAAIQRRVENDQLTQNKLVPLNRKVFPEVK